MIHDFAEFDRFPGLPDEVDGFLIAFDIEIDDFCEVLIQELEQNQDTVGIHDQLAHIDELDDMIILEMLHQEEEEI